MLKKLLMALAVLTAGLSAAFATTVAVSTANVNLRAGPSTSYPVVVVVPRGASLVTYGCVADYAWCDVAFNAYRGWVSAGHIQVTYQGTTAVMTPAVASQVGVSVVVYDRVYWDTYYVAQPWYGSWAAYYSPYVPAVPRLEAYGGAAACVDGACAGISGATGVYGGSTVQARTCEDGSCTATRETTGAFGNSASRVRTCSAGDLSCDMTRSGPAGRTVTGGRSISR